MRWWSKQIAFLAAALMAPLLIPAVATAEAPRVVVSVKPVHSLVAGVMAGVGEPALLLQGGSSPHDYALRPSDAAVLGDAEVVFWVGDGLESFLARPLQTLATNAEVVTLATDAGLHLLPLRAGGTWEPHRHDDGEPGHARHSGGDDHDHDDGHDHDHGAHDDHDLHVWLDPDNAGRIVATAVTVLSRRDPGHADAYAANGRQLAERLTRLDDELKRQLAAVAGRGYIVFHDAYHYFEDHFGLQPLGSITLSPDRKPGAKRLYELRRRLIDSGAACVFSEPQFEPALARTLVEGTQARVGELDPLGATLPPGPEAYFTLMRSLAAGLTGCLVR